MVHVVLLWMLLEVYPVALSADWPIKRKSIVRGDLYLGGFFPIHRMDNDRMCGRIMDEGLVELEAMLHTVKTINDDDDLLQNIHLGVVAVDSCDSVPKALEEAVDFAKGFLVKEDSFRNNGLFQCDGGGHPEYESGIYNKVVAVIGGHSSWVSMQVANMMRIYKIPQVSYQSTNPDLSDKTRYEYFFRTVPPLQHQVKAILGILNEFGWKYVSVVYADSDYGNKGFEVLKYRAKQQKICYSSPHRINVEHSNEKDYDFVVTKLLQSNAKVVIVFSDHEMARNLISAATRARAFNKFVWIGSTAWVSREYVTKGNERTMEGAIGITHDIKALDNFDTYLKNRKLEKHNESNPWFPEYWEETKKCRVRNSEETPFNQNYTEFCSPDDELPTECYTRATPAVQFVRDAVYAVAHALHNMLNETCKRRGQLCSTALKDINGEKLREYLQNVVFDDESGNPFRFNKDGDGPPRYSIVHFQKISETENQYRWKPVGSYNYFAENDARLELKRGGMIYKDYQPSFPKSRCGAPCKNYEAKVMLDADECCWHCINCTEFQYVKDSTSCQNCSDGTLPSPYKDTCIEIPVRYMSISNSWAIGCVVFSLLGMVMAVFVAVVLKKYWNTAIFMVSGRELSLILLIGIFLSFALTFAIVSQPSPASCGIVRLFVGLFYTISYATVCAKTRHISKLFYRRSANKKLKPVKMKSLLIMTQALIAVEATINATWLLHSPPATGHHYPNRRDSVLICMGSDTSGYLVGLVYPFFLVIFCTCYAFKFRNFVGAFYESRYINFTNYTTLIVWLAFLPIFLVNNISELRVVVLSLLLNLSSLIQLVCLFMPKVYIALRRPEKNKHENGMYYDGRKSLTESDFTGRNAINKCTK